MDSDEEDDEEEGSSKYDILASEDVEGEVYANIESAGGTNWLLGCGPGLLLSLLDA